ncbi:MAG: hypothetical protein AAGI38_08560 [Bacteroidota bacterium]
MSETLKERVLTTYEQMILPYKQKLEQSQKTLEQIQREIEQRNHQLIRLGLQLNLPMTQLIQMTQLPQQEVENIIQSIRREEK